MKKLFFVFIILLQFINSYADCSGFGWNFFPSKNNANSNSVFIIEGYANAQIIINELNKKHKVYLKSDADIVNLSVSDIYVGEFELTQALLKPERNLTVGKKYELIIEGFEKDEYNKPKRYNTTTRLYENVSWTIVANIDIEAPKWISKPTHTKDVFQMFGCGPEMYSVFNFKAYDNSELLVKATVKNIKTGKESIYYLKPDSNLISIGHGMCSGEFTFDDSEFYEVEFSLMDASGNKTAWEGERIKFTNPQKIKNK